MKLFNLTPHTINIVCVNGGNIISFPPVHQPARVLATTEHIGVLLGEIPVSSSIFGETFGLPKEGEGIAFIVSRIVVAANPERGDLYFPNELVRDEDGKVLGAQSLAQS
jgi:hypothetical protein